MTELTLRDAFQNRKGRFRLLDRGIACAQWHGERLRILEVGCANGGAAAHLGKSESFDLISVDVDPEVVKEAAAEHPDCCFVYADACSLPFPDESFDGIFSEAAFSVIPDKAAAVSEYQRVLKPGGRLLMNDFFLKRENEKTHCPESGIPCVDGVRSFEAYRDLLDRAGLSCILFKEYYYDYLSIAESLSRTYAVEASQISGFILRHFGTNPFVENFFAQADISYAQMIFEKRIHGSDL